MNIHTADIPHLPLIAALLGASNQVLAATPEWQGTADEAISYPIRDQRLIVNPMTSSPSNPAVQAAMNQLIEELEKAASSETDPSAKARLRMLAISLRAVIGRRCTTLGGTVADLLTCIAAGSEARIGGAPEVNLLCPPETTCTAPEALGLLLIQMIVNAHVHAGVSVEQIKVTIHNAKRFGVVWPGKPPISSVKTSRIGNPESGWGLSFAQTIADTLGGKVYPPRPDGPNRVRTACEIDVNRVVIPLALIGLNQTITQTSPTWIEETGWKVGDAAANPDWSPLIAKAKEKPGSIIFQAGRSARLDAQAAKIWLGIPPIDLPARIDAALHGVEHEVQLWQEVAPKSAYTIRALSKIVRWLRTDQPPTSNRAYWLSNWAPAIQALTGNNLRAPGIKEISVLDATICAYLYATYGQALEAQGGTIWIHGRPEASADPIWQALSNNSDRIPLGGSHLIPAADEDPNQPDRRTADRPQGPPPTAGLPLKQDDF